MFLTFFISFFTLFFGIIRKKKKKGRKIWIGYEFRNEIV